ncbi:hypothetical protein E7811_12770 [Aliigemmobacter aestuarii]|uniref:Gamma-glutamyl kinase n=1 Tax=Aliigemmobacter aestuarii TaxID=1445661 RepID=A0A4V3V0A2_9RHOB|nr:hypothetical protein [Gemmobacter aestuarii]THD83010.1 hypothetical protein E7811_12770 [Gemmobacter aestuarii]
MLVFWEQRLAFLATPKTGTTAIESALESLAALSIQRPPILKHTTVMRYHRFIAPYLEVSSGQEFDVVAVMREPRSWLSSWYRYRQRDDITDPRRSTQGITFDEFVRAYCAEEPPEFAAVGSQAQFFKPRNGKGLTRLFRYEAIDSFVDFLEDRLGCAITLPRVNVSPEGDTDLSGATEDLLRRYLKADFEIYAAIRD